MERNVPIDGLTRLLDELSVDPGDLEHADVAVTDESGWSLTILRPDSAGRYRLIWEDVEESVAAPTHMADVKRDEALRVMALVAEGRLDDVSGLSWDPGY